MSKFLLAPIDRIVGSRWQPRESVGDSEAFEGLVANIRLHGITTPLKAFVNGKGTYELITGHRRWQAAMKAGLSHVPLIVVDTPQDEAGLRALREEVIFDNILHEPLTPLEEARAFKALQEEGYSIRQMAERLGKSKGYIQNRLDLLRMPDDVQRLVYLRKYTSHAREIAKVKAPDLRAKLIKEAQTGASYQEIKARVDQIVSTGAGVSRSPSAPDLQVSARADASRRARESAGGDHLSGDNDELSPDSIPPGAEPPITQKAKRFPGITAAGEHCPHCGDSRGREVCNVCGKERWIIAFPTLEDYQRALAMVGILLRPKEQDGAVVVSGERRCVSC